MRVTAPGWEIRDRCPGVDLGDVSLGALGHEELLGRRDHVVGGADQRPGRPGRRRSAWRLIRWTRLRLPGRVLAGRRRRRGRPRRRAAHPPQPSPGQAITIQALNQLNAPVDAAYRELAEAEAAAAAIPARVPLGDLSPDMMRLDTDTKQITHAIRMAAYNAQTTLARTSTATTPAPKTRPTPSSARPSPDPATSTPAASSYSSASTRSPHPAAPAPSPHSASTSIQPRPATPAPTWCSATRSSPTPALHDLLAIAGDLGT